MISINDLTVSFGGFTLLNNINFHISENEHLALVGKNGAGKSTILKLIAGVEKPSSGSIARPSSLSVGYLPQIMQYSKDRTVLEEAMSAFAEMDSLSERLAMAEKEMECRTDYESDGYRKLLIEVNDLNDRLAIYRSENPEMMAERTLTGLGFRREDLGKSRRVFSQGWNMRVELARILLSRPDVLLLDEPTNHLDIESIQWLEDYLVSFKGTLVLISHDRRFLDRVTSRTVEIVLGRIYDYKVPYSKYLQLRKERMEQQKAAYQNQQRMIEKTEEFIERFRYKPTKSNQVQSRIKQLDRIERIEVDEEDRSELSLRFPPAPRSGRVVFEADGLTGGYTSLESGEKLVFSGVDMVVQRGEKVAFVGRNGEGKSTMMKIITGSLPPIKGNATVGYNVSIGYYAQNQEDILDKDDTVYDTLDKVAVGDVRTRLRDILGAFLFRGEDIDKKVAVLSGGERSRLAMAKLILHPYNLLALDEPTNHMDIRSKDILKQALKSYDGTLIIVSHDRDFLDGLADKLYEFRDGKVKEHLGTVSEFLERRKIESLNELERHYKPVEEKPYEEQKKTASQQEYQARKFVSKEERRRKNRITYLEKSIEEIEGKMKSIEERLASPAPEDDIMELTREYLELKRELDAKTDEWVSLGSEDEVSGQ